MRPILPVSGKGFAQTIPLWGVTMLALLMLAFLLPARGAFAQDKSAHSLADIPRSEHEHDSPEWADIARHLPDPATASSARLEMTADVLRARRYDAEALGFYNAALDHGADRHVVLKKMGVTCLQMQQPILARMLFTRAIHLNKRDAVAWNDLGAADLALGNAGSAVGEYRRALKVDHGNAIFHANLALAYFEVRSPDKARRELQKALNLDPEVLRHGTGSGFNAQVLSSQHYGDICLQMAHLYAQNGDESTLLEWLGKASERGINLQAAMDHDIVLRPWLKDARIRVLLQNRQRLTASTKPPADIPSLGAASLPQ